MYSLFIIWKSPESILISLIIPIDLLSFDTISYIKYSSSAVSE